MRWYKNNNSIITLSDEELNKKFAWKSKCFKNPFFGFEKELELREFKKLIDSYVNKNKDKHLDICLRDVDYKNIDLFFFFYLKQKLYGTSVRRILHKNIEEYQFSFLTKDNLQKMIDSNLFIKLYISTLEKQKKKKDLYISDNWKSFFQQDYKEQSALSSLTFSGTLKHCDNNVEASWSDLNKNRSYNVNWVLNEDMPLEQQITEVWRDRSFFSGEYSYWAFNHRILSEIKQKLDQPLEDTVSSLFEDSQVNILKESDIKKMVFWSERNIPFFFLNQKTGYVDYDFWNNTAERVERRELVLKLWLKGQCTWNDVKAQTLYISRNSLRGFFGFHDIVLRHDLSMQNLQTSTKYLPFYNRIYNLFQKTSEKGTYSRTLFGLIGPTLIPHWCLLFTMTKKRKNIYFTISDMAGKVLLTVSAGKFNINRKKRFSPHALEPLFQEILNCLKKTRIKNIILVVKFKAKYMYMHTLNFLRKNRISVKLVIEKLPIPHNGIRARKQKRL